MLFVSPWLVVCLYFGIITLYIYKYMYKNSVDLDLDNYSLQDLYKLFQIPSEVGLNDDIMKRAKKIVHATHPDKSNFDADVYRFFAAAYTRLHGIYEFQNKRHKTPGATTGTYEQVERDDDASKISLLANFNKRELNNDPARFNSWFNEQFNKYKTDDDDNGYGDWLKTDDGGPQLGHVTKANMNEIFERQKREARDLALYTGVEDSSISSSTTMGCDLHNSAGGFNSGMFSGGGGGVGYTDLKQAHNESVIPVTNDDYASMRKFSSVDEYKSHRNSQSFSVPTQDESHRMLNKKSADDEAQSAALAYRYALESENAQKNSEQFWGELRHITSGADGANKPILK